MGYLVVPDDLVDRVAAAKSVMTRHASVLERRGVRELAVALGA